MANRTKIHPLVARGIQQLVRTHATNVDGTPMTQQQFADALDVCADTVAAAVNGTGGYRYQGPAVLADGNGSKAASNGSKAASDGSKAASNGSKAATEKEPTGETLPEALVLDALQDLAGAVRDLEHALGRRAA